MKYFKAYKEAIAMSKTYTPESILGLLEAGHSSDELARNFTDALNSALELQEKKEKEQAAAEEARRKADEARAREQAAAEAKRKLQIAEGDALLEHVRDYLSDYYPNLKFEDNMTGEKLIEFIDGYVKVEKLFKNLPNFDKVLAEEPSWFNDLLM